MLEGMTIAFKKIEKRIGKYCLHFCAIECSMEDCKRCSTSEFCEECNDKFTLSRDRRSCAPITNNDNLTILSKFSLLIDLNVEAFEFPSFAVAVVVIVAFIFMAVIAISTFIAAWFWCPWTKR